MESSQPRQTLSVQEMHLRAAASVFKADAQVIEEGLRAHGMRLEAFELGIKMLLSRAEAPLSVDPNELRAKVRQIIHSIAAAGLDPHPDRGYCYLVPYKNRGVATSQFQLGYKAYVYGYSRLGIALSAGVVFEGQEYEMYEGSQFVLKVKPMLDCYTSGPNGDVLKPIIFSWAILNHPNGLQQYAIATQYELKRAGYMTKSGFWAQHPIPMCQKTAIMKLKTVSQALWAFNALDALEHSAEDQARESAASFRAAVDSASVVEAEIAALEEGGGV